MNRDRGGFFVLCLIMLGSITASEAQQLQYIKQGTDVVYAGNGGAILACDPTSAVAETVATLPNGDAGNVLCVAEGGRTLFVGSGGGAVYKLTIGSKPVMVAGSAQLLQSSAYGTNITGLACDVSGKTLYACGQNNVYKIDVSKRPWTVTQLANLTGPAQIITTSLALGDSGLYVGYTTAGEQFGSQINLISRTTPGKVLKSFGLGPPQEMVVAHNGTLLVATNNHLYLLNKTLGNLASVQIPGGTPNGLALSDDGSTAYVATFNQDNQGINNARLIRVSVTANTLTIKDTLSLGSKFPVGVALLSKQNKALVGMAPPTIYGSQDNSVKIIDMSGPQPVISHSIRVTSGPTFYQAAVASLALLETTLDMGGEISGLAVNPKTNRIYVSCGSASNVKVIDGATNTVLATVNRQIGDRPSAIGIDTATNTIYVASYNSDEVVVINGATNAVVDSVATGDSPIDIAVNPVTRKIYVANSNAHSLTIIDGSTNEVDTTIGMGSAPKGIAVNTTSNKVYWLNHTNQTVMVIDDSTYTVDTTLSVRTTPLCIAFNPVTKKIYTGEYNRTDGLDGYWLPNEPRYSVKVFNAATNTEDTTLHMSAEPICIAVNSATNTIYAGVAGYLTAIVGGSNAMKTVYLPANSTARFIDVNPMTGKIYVVNGVSSSLLVIDERPTQR